MKEVGERVVCANCPRKFKRVFEQDDFCSTSCRITVLRRKRLCKSTNMNSGDVGAVLELLASADLMKKGFAVFRALSPCCPFDLVVVKDGVLKSVEVRAAYMKHSNSLPLTPNSTHKADVLAAITWDGVIRYVPDITKSHTTS